MFRTLRIFLTSFPLPVILWKLRCRLLGEKIPAASQWQQPFTGKKGLEIGGPSAMFTAHGYLPVYPLAASLDGVNFSTSTIWEGKIREGRSFQYAGKTGYQFIAEGTNLSAIADREYDFVLSCNNLEHIANPLAALLEWKRVIRRGGSILLVLPNKIANFDHRRPDTEMAHLVDDFEKSVGEDDQTHRAEIIALHDLKRDPQAGGPEKFVQRCRENINNRCFHHHVFSPALLREVISYCGMRADLQYSSKTDHFILATKI